MPVDQNAARLKAIQGKQAGSTIQLGHDFLSYARARLDPVAFKEQLVERLLPTVPRRGKPRRVRPREPFGKFEIRGRLGKGGMAEVHLAGDPELTQGGGSRDTAGLVALKVMRKDIAHDLSYVQRFLREAANTALIEHPNVVRVHEVGSVEGRLYYTMELIEGETLKEHLTRGPLDEVEGVQVLCQLVDGLVAAHERGIGHRDLKPANVMLVTNEARYGVDLADAFDVVVKITDFGLAQMLDADQSVGDQGSFLGTAKYVAPEVIKGEKATLKSDVFSLGILAFQMFAGRPPFMGRNKMEYLTANLQAAAPKLDTLAPVSEDLALLVDRMLAKSPDERPGTDTLRQDLGRLAERARPGARVVVDDDESSVFFRASDVVGGAEPGVKAPPAAALAAVGAVVLAGLLAFLFVGGDDAPPEGPPAVVDASPLPTPERTTAPSGTPSPSPSGTAPSGDPLLVPFETPGHLFASTRDREEYPVVLAAGDAAWREGRERDAFEAWSRAVEVAGGRGMEVPAPLLARLAEARRRVRLAEARAADASGDARAALEAYEAAVAAGVEDPEALARRDALRERVAEEQELDRRLVAARRLAREDPPAAVAELEALLPLARRLGRAELVRAALTRLGVEAPPEDAPTPPPAEDPARGPAGEEEAGDAVRAAALLDRAEQLLVARSYSAARQALRHAIDSGGQTERAARLARRLDWAEATPPGSEYLELGDDAGGLPRAFYASAARVSHRAFYAWFRVASREVTLRQPRSWEGRGRPPAGREDEPVTGVRLDEARRFAEGQGRRLPTPEEAARIRAARGAPADHGALEDDAFPSGFWTVEDPVP